MLENKLAKKSSIQNYANVLTVEPGEKSIAEPSPSNERYSGLPEGLSGAWPKCCDNFGLELVTFGAVPRRLTTLLSSFRSKLTERRFDDLSSLMWVNERERKLLFLPFFLFFKLLKMPFFFSPIYNMSRSDHTSKYVKLNRREDKRTTRIRIEKRQRKHTSIFVWHLAVLLLFQYSVPSLPCVQHELSAHCRLRTKS